MLSPELYPPAPGDPFLIDTPRAPKPPFQPADNPAPFSDVLEEKSNPLPAPQPDPTDDAPPAQDPLVERDSSADNEHPDADATEDIPGDIVDAEIPVPTHDPTPKPDTAPKPNGQNVPAESTQTSAAPPAAGVIEPLVPGRSPIPGPPQQPRNAPTQTASAQQPTTGAQAETQAQGATSQQAAGATNANQQPAQSTQSLSTQAPTDNTEAQTISKQAAQLVATPTDQIKPTEQTPAEPQRAEQSTTAQPASSASTQNQSGQQSNQQSTDQQPDPRAQQVFKAEPADQQATYRAEPLADARAAAPVAPVTPAAEPAAAPKIAGPSIAQSHEHAQLTAEETGKFRAGLTRGLNAVLRTSGGSLSMNLTPPTLGKVSIEMTMQDGRVNLQLTAANEQAHRLLNENIAMLRTTLEGKGLKVERLAVQVSTNTAQSQSASSAPSAQQNADSSQQEQNQDASQGQSRGRSDQNTDSNTGGDRPEDPTLGSDQTQGERGGASFANKLELSLDAVA